MENGGEVFVFIIAGCWWCNLMNRLEYCKVRNNKVIHRQDPGPSICIRHLFAPSVSGSLVVAMDQRCVPTRRTYAQGCIHER